MAFLLLGFMYHNESCKSSIKVSNWVLSCLLILALLLFSDVILLAFGGRQISYCPLGFLASFLGLTCFSASRIRRRPFFQVFDKKTGFVFVGWLLWLFFLSLGGEGEMKVHRNIHGAPEKKRKQIRF